MYTLCVQKVADRVSSLLSKSSVFHADSFHCIALDLLLLSLSGATRVVCYCVTAPCLCVCVRFYSAIHCYLPFLRGPSGHRVANHFRSTNSSLSPIHVSCYLSGPPGYKSDEILFHHARTPSQFSLYAFPISFCWRLFVFFFLSANLRGTNKNQKLR